MAYSQVNSWKDVLLNIAICGQSGTGKSTIINTLRASNRPTKVCAKWVSQKPRRKSVNTPIRSTRTLSCGTSQALGHQRFLPSGD